MSNLTFEQWHTARWLELRAEFMRDYEGKNAAVDFQAWLLKKYVDEYPADPNTGDAP